MSNYFAHILLFFHTILSVVLINVIMIFGLADLQALRLAQMQTFAEPYQVILTQFKMLQINISVYV